MSRIGKLISLICLLLAFAGMRAMGQGIVTGYITGTVVDQQGAVVPNANVVVTQAATNAKFTVTTLANGVFEVRNLPPSTYTVEISAPGFTPLKLNNVTVAVGVETALKNQTLSVGANQTVVTVESTAVPLLSTTQAQISTEFTPLQITSLPVNAGFDSLALTAQPGVAGAHDAMFGNSSGSYGYSGLSVNGERSRSVNFEIDGQNNNDNSVTGPQFFFNNGEALQEFQVVTGVYGAQYGRSTGAVVNYVTKSGTNAFHGSGYEFFTGSFLRSLTNAQKNPLFGYCASGQNAAVDGCLEPTVPRYVENQYGGTLGGPILKDKLWFFGSTFWDPIREGAAPASSGSSLTPTPNGLQQLQAAFPGNPAVTALGQFGPFAIKPGNPIVVPGSTTLRTVSDGNSSAAIEFGAVQRLEPAEQRSQQHLGRLDWQPTAKDRMFVRYMYSDTLQTGALSGTADSDIAQGDFYNVPATNHSIGADWTHTFTSSLVNQLRYGFQQAKLFFTPGALPDCTVNSLLNCPAFVQIGGANVNIGLDTAFPQGRTVKVNQIQDNATFIHGNHSITFGGEFEKQNSPNVGLNNYNGTYTFGSFNTFLQGGSAAANDFLTLADGSPVLPFSEPDVDGFVQDDWKVRPDLTLNLGLRYEWYSQSVNLLHDMTLSRETNPATAFWDTTLPLSQRIFHSIPQDYKKIQPRIGFAWNPQFLDQKLVVRGGYAINADPAFYNIFLNAAASAPVVNSGNIGCDNNCLPSGGIQGSVVRTQYLPSLPRGVDPGLRTQTIVAPNFHNPYAQTFTLGVQYEVARGLVAEVRYLGNHTIGNFQRLNVNPYLGPVAADFPGYPGVPSLCTDPNAAGFGRPDCTHSNVTSVGNTAFSVYNALQTQLSMRAFHGLTATANYTFSRSIDNTSEIFATGAGGNTSSQSQNPLNTNVAERGVSGFSYPNIASLSAVYQVPLFQNRHDWEGRLFGGFSVNAIYQYNTGQPFTVSQGSVANVQGDNPINFESYDIPGLAVGTPRPVLSNNKAPLQTVGIYIVDPQSQITTGGTGYYVYNGVDDNGVYNQPTTPQSVHWLWNNQALAQLMGNPFPGNGRNTLRGQDYNNLDASVFKTVPITERLNLQLQLNAYNVLNHQYFGAPDPQVEDFTPGFAYGFLSPALFESGNFRTLQIGGKITF
jgi:outer membrane receptor protein involved in Fe transport